LIGRITAPAGRAIACASLITACVLAAACSSSGSRANISPGVGTGSGVVITTSTGTVLLQEGATLTLTATVGNDTNNAGVTWSLSGLGSLSDATTTQVTYNAPPAGTITGTSVPVVTATSVAESTQSSAVSLVVAGTPVIDPMTLFPANVNTAWGANVVVAGGESPYSWAVSSGSLPPGITLGASTGTVVALSGTPTATGTYTFQLQATDKQSRIASVDLTLIVNPQTACLLVGRYAMLYTGFAGQKMLTRAASLDVASDGTVSGVMDTRSASATVESEALTGTCTTRTANNGTLTVTGSTSGKLEFNFAVRASLVDGRVQLMNGGSDASGTGLISQQDASAFALAQLPQSAAFGLLGVDGDDASMGLAGWLDRDAGGTVIVGGSLSAPDSVSGRGQLTLSIGGSSYSFVYYVVSANRLLLVNMDSNAASQRLAGFLTPRAASFDASALATPGILSLWGAASGAYPVAVLTLARLSNADTAAGTLDLHLDTSNRGSIVADVAVAGASYGVDSHGRATLSFSQSGGNRSFALYLDAASNGYAVEKGSATGNAGLLEAQSGAPFSNVLPGLFVFGTQYAQSPGPMTLAPIINFSSGVMSGNYVTGYYSLDTTTGRGTGTLSVSGQIGSSMLLYVVRPERVLVLQFGGPNHDGTLNWVDE
jgi:hypothetical protein